MKKAFTKNYAQRRIAVVCIVLIVVTSGILTLLTGLYYSRLVSQTTTANAERFQKNLTDVLNYTDLSEIEDPENDLEYRAMREYFRAMCDTMGAKYVYLFRTAKGDEMLHYIMTAAADDEEDKQVSVERGLGVSVKAADREYIDRALDGESLVQSRLNNQYGNVLIYYSPIYYEGKISAIAGMDFDVTKLSDEAMNYVLSIVLIVTGVLTAVLVLLLLVLRKKVFAPIKRISVQMNSFDPEQEHPKLKLNSYQEIEEINNSFNKLSEDIIGYIKNLRVMSEDRAKTAAELDIARRIQIGMVPESYSLSDSGFDLFAGAAPAKEVGGDFYDCFVLGTSVYAVIGDVSGKGIAAALFMAMARNIIREKLRVGLSPADALNSANDILCAENPEGMFVTVFASVLDTRTGELVYANAGHTRPLFIGGGRKQFLTPETGIALGLFEDSGIVNEVTVLGRGSSLTVYTDGITEAVSKDKKLFGEERLLEAAREGTAEQVYTSVTDAVHTFAEGCEQSDDMTLITFCFTGTDPMISKVLEPDMEAVGIMRSSLLKLAEDSPLKRKMILACEEMLVNVVNYSGTDKIGLIISRSGDLLTVRLEDGGKPFDPTESIPAEKDFDDYDSGGMGIRMVTQIAESTSYSRISDKNILTLVFRL